MPLFTWYDKYSINNEELDNHHKMLFDIFNKMYDTCLKIESINCLEPIIDELISYSKYHFSAEEKYMEEKGYKDIENHKQMHKEFSQKAIQMKQCDKMEDLEIKKELAVFLGNWLIQHVIKEDRKISV